MTDPATARVQICAETRRIATDLDHLHTMLNGLATGPYPAPARPEDLAQTARAVRQLLPKITGILSRMDTLHDGPSPELRSAVEELEYARDALSDFYDHHKAKRVQK